MNRILGKLHRSSAANESIAVPSNRIQTYQLQFNQ